jgi:hypothetical protein
MVFKMKITQMIKQLGGNRAAIAKAAGISIQHLNNMVSKGVEVKELPSGDFIVVRKDATVFKGKKH